MSHISEALESISTHRDVVPVYFHRASKRWIVTGVCKTNGGAIVLDEAGGLQQFYASKAQAICALRAITN